MAATIRERLSWIKVIKQHLLADRYNLLDREIRQEYQIDVANRFSALEGFEISSVDDTWVKIRDSIKATAKEKVGVLETNRNKPCFNQECSELANKRKQTKLLWRQNPNGQTAEDISNVRRDTCKTFRKNKGDYMKAKVNKLEENSKNKNIREMYKGIINSRRTINLAPT
jgi:hypothetical protein